MGYDNWDIDQPSSDSQQSNGLVYDEAIIKNNGKCNSARMVPRVAQKCPCHHTRSVTSMHAGFYLPLRT